jgi:hypothetical protein
MLIVGAVEQPVRAGAVVNVTAGHAERCWDSSDVDAQRVDQCHAVAGQGDVGDLGGE